MSSLFPSIPSLALVMTNIQGRASLYRILFGFVTFVRLRSRGPANGDRQGAPWGSPLECSCVKLPPVLVRVIARLTAVSSAARGMLATRWPASCEVQAPAEVAHSHGLYRRPSTKRRAPGSWCDWGGLSHSGDPHTTMYRLTLPSVEHAGCAELHTRQSRTGLATEERQPSEPWSKLKHMPLPRNSAWEAGYSGLRGVPTDDGSRGERPGRV